ncbi:replication-relaxation family protein [Streptomyces sp. NPDC088197]|uniref:replication-relaxation family protein n=1 Tax=Streptomyces sp. NPDC088197 TaxID=3365840 RepID=UPI00381EFF6D
MTLARLRLAEPEQLRALLLDHQEGTDYVRRALRNLAAERPPLVGRVQRAQQSYWFCTTAGLAVAPASGLLPAFNGSAGARTTGRKAAAKTGLREHGLALVDTALAFHHSGAADAGDWQLEAAHPTPAGPLIPNAVVLLATGGFAFVELDRGTMSYARLMAKLDRYAAYRTAPPSGRGTRPGRRARTGRTTTPGRTSSSRSRGCWWCSRRRRGGRRRPPGRRSSWPARLAWSRFASAAWPSPPSPRPGWPRRPGRGGVAGRRRPGGRLEPGPPPHPAVSQAAEDLQERPGGCPRRLPVGSCDRAPYEVCPPSGASAADLQAGQDP